MKYKVIVGDLVEESCDVLIVWSFHDMKSGPEPFADVVRKADSQAYYSFYALKEHLKPSDAVTTIGGGTKASRILFSIFPVNEEKFQDSFYNIRQTLDTYSKKNLCRFVSLSMPSYKKLDNLVMYMNTYLQDMVSLKEVRIFCKSEEAKELIKKSLQKVQTKKVPWYKRIFT